MVFERVFRQGALRFVSALGIGAVVIATVAMRPARTGVLPQWSLGMTFDDVEYDAEDSAAFSAFLDVERQHGHWWARCIQRGAVLLSPREHRVSVAEREISVYRWSSSLPRGWKVEMREEPDDYFAGGDQVWRILPAIENVRSVAPIHADLIRAHPDAIVIEVTEGECPAETGTLRALGKRILQQ